MTSNAPRIESGTGLNPAHFCPACTKSGIVDIVEVPDHEYGLDFVATYACCKACGTLYQSPMPSDADLASFYRNNYHSMSDGGFLMLLRHKMRIRRLKALLGKKGAVLDYGCGNGSFLRRAAADIPNVEFIGYEIGDRREVTQLAERVTIVQGSPADLVEILPPCQAMIMNHVIEHIPDPYAIVSMLAGKLLPGGVFDGQTPNAVSLEHRIFGVRWSGFHAPRHTVVFSNAGLHSMFERAGFEQISIRGAFNPAGYAISFAGLPHGNAKGLIPRHGLKWLMCVAAATMVLPVDVGSGAPGMIDFMAKKRATNSVRAVNGRKQYSKRSDLLSSAVVVTHIAFVLAPIYLAAAIGPSLILIPIWMWFGLTMQGLLNLIHECAHYHVFKKRWASDLLGRWILAPLVLADFDNYRTIHWAHHRELGGAKDPKYSYKVEIGGWRLPLFFIECLTGIEAWRKLNYQNRERANTDFAKSRFWMVRVVVFHGVFVASLLATAWSFEAHAPQTAALNAAVAYAMSLYAVASVTLFAATLRAIAEHQDGADHPSVAGQAALRNLKCGPIQRLIFGCYGFAEHATHHRYPAIPSYRLIEATTELARDAPGMIPHFSYSQILLAQSVGADAKTSRSTRTASETSSQPR